MKLFGGHETLGATAVFALIHLMNKSRLLDFGARKPHFLTALDAVWRIRQRRRFVHVKAYPVLKRDQS